MYKFKIIPSSFKMKDKHFKIFYLESSCNFEYEEKYQLSPSILKTGNFGERNS